MNDNTPSELTDRRMMQAALREARLAFDADEVPVGAVVAYGDRIIGRGHNLTEALADVTAHAEMQALTAAAQTLGGKYLDGCTLYVTVEPCVMCAGAIGWAQIKRVVYGASDPKRGYSSITCRSPFHPRCEVTAGVLEPECSALMRTFFARKRPQRKP
ncbi:MAG: nucleoside deaminase [Candidatus Amulumruptor caecigallinarius]|nr:nucleoside deaminase [Candidatus Amulumruptor caecigallinarius]MCM1397189.1 nucleoside deaminase [Candidatus Amulumruptor caecigallinarius]MCM1453122.1 nucleoside deaminase [bacterium]